MAPLYAALNIRIDRANKLVEETTRENETLDSGKLHANYLHGILTLILFDKTGKSDGSDRAGERGDGA